ncbi:MAG: hypothetical protein H3C26_15750 [Rhodocyclaceae bacterium]|nr:hypothetical protein [Rhodocyclaceae bacterium]
MKQSTSDAGVTAENRKTRYLPYLKAQDILHKRINATVEDMVGWVWCGPEDGGLAAYLNANELDPPPRFYFQYGGPDSGLNYMAELLGCWFLASDLEEFSPISRFISGAVLRDRWVPLLGSADAVVNFIATKERESRILPFHPLTGETNISGGDYMPDWTTALFVLSHVKAIEAEEFPADALPNQTSVASATNNETPRDRRIRIASMRKNGMSGAEIGRLEGISVSMANRLAAEGGKILQKQAEQATSLIGQLTSQGVAGKNTKTKTG